MNRSEENIFNIRPYRRRLLKYSHNAFKHIQIEKTPKILDLGCGNGIVTLELAKWTKDGQVTGIDTDKKAIIELNEVAKASGLASRVKGINASIYDLSFPLSSFDVIWAEGVFHLLDLTRCLAILKNIIKDGGFLVQHDTNRWMSANLQHYDSFGFKFLEELPLPSGSWWDEYYGPIDAAINEYIDNIALEVLPDEINQYRSEIELIRPDPVKFDTSFYIFKQVLVQEM
jgi:SAM-dependent methyltransferase